MSEPYIELVLELKTELAIVGVAIGGGGGGSSDLSALPVLRMTSLSGLAGREVPEILAASLNLSAWSGLDSSEIMVVVVWFSNLLKDRYIV